MASSLIMWLLAAAGKGRSPGDASAACAVGTATLACYCLTTAHTVLLEDDGFFLQAAWFNAAAHPPGYPLYVALAHLATLVPAGTVALRVHALTGLFAAVACVLLFLLARRLGMSRAVAVIAALAYGFSDVFWSQAIIAEVYSLNVLLFLACALAAMELGRRPEVFQARTLAGFALLYGLGLANHWPLLVLSTPALLALAWPARRTLLRNAPLLLVGVLTGLLPYAWMIWRTHVVPEYCFAGPITSWQDFRFYVGREGYAATDHSPTAGWHDRLQFSAFVAREVAHQFGWSGAILGTVGFVQQWRRLPGHVCAFLVFGFLGNTLVLLALLGFDYDELHRSMFRVYPLIAYAIFVLWIALGLQCCIEYAATRLRGRVAPGMVAAAAGAVLAGATFLAHLPDNYRREDRWAEVYGRAVLESLPPGARFYGNSDTVNGPIGYLHRILGVRPDITLVSGTSLPLEGALYRPYAMPRAELEALLVRYVRMDAGPMFYTSGFPQSFAQDDYGLYFGVNTDAAPGAYRAVVAPRILEFFQFLDDIPMPFDAWESIHYRRLRQDQCRLAVGRALGVIPRDINALPPACEGLQGRLWLAEQLRSAGGSAAEVILDWLPEDRALLIQATSKSELARFHFLRAWARQELTRAPGARGSG